MATYSVPFVAVAESFIWVEADTPEEAICKAYEEFDYPGTNISNDFEIGDWAVSTDAQWSLTTAEKQDSDLAIRNNILKHN